MEKLTQEMGPQLPVASEAYQSIELVALIEQPATEVTASTSGYPQDNNTGSIT
jgi:hypothetical protein